MIEKIKDIIVNIVCITIIIGGMVWILIDEWNNPPKEYIYECETVQGEIVYCKYVHEPTRATPLLYGETKDGKTVQITSYRRVERDANQM